MWAPREFRCPLEPAWLDYNGHLRDAYYGVIASLAVDALMDELGLDAAYRARTRGTLYTLEAHQRFLVEVKSGAVVHVDTHLLEHDRKRLRTLHVLRTAPHAAPAAVIEYVLLHVQQDDPPHSAPLPEHCLARLEAWSALPLPAELAPLGSRAMKLGGSR